DALESRQPDELKAQRAGVRHPQIADERHEAPPPAILTRRTDRCRVGLERRDTQEATCRRARDLRRARRVTRQLRVSVSPRVPAKEPVIEIDAIERSGGLEHGHMKRRMVPYGPGSRNEMPCYALMFRVARKWRNWQTRRT